MCVCVCVCVSCVCCVCVVCVCLCVCVCVCDFRTTSPLLSRPSRSGHRCVCVHVCMCMCVCEREREQLFRNTTTTLVLLVRVSCVYVRVYAYVCTILQTMVPELVRRLGRVHMTLVNLQKVLTFYVQSTYCTVHAELGEDENGIQKYGGTPAQPFFSALPGKRMKRPRRNYY